MWPSGQKIFVFGSRTSLLSEDQIRRKYYTKVDKIESGLVNRLTSVTSLATMMLGRDMKTLRKQCNV